MVLCLLVQQPSCTVLRCSGKPPLSLHGCLLSTIQCRRHRLAEHTYRWSACPGRHVPTSKSRWSRSWLPQRRSIYSCTFWGPKVDHTFLSLQHLLLQCGRMIALPKRLHIALGTSCLLNLTQWLVQGRHWTLWIVQPELEFHRSTKRF